MEINQEMKPHVEELEKYSFALMEFIVENIDNPITHLLQIEFNCLFRVYNDKINYICDFFNIDEEDISSHSFEGRQFEVFQDADVDAEYAIELFMQYVEGFLLDIENNIPSLPN